jgi:serine-type D-Ala-D-Ala carboxypeptidase (penicillin-binding protein 5/6)
VNRPSRPPLYGLEAGRRRRRRRGRGLRLPPLAAVVVVVFAVLVAASAFVAYRLWPLTDRSAGYIGPPVASAPPPGGGTTPPATGALRPMSAVSASRVRIPGVNVSAGIVVDSATGDVLWEHDPHRQLPIASLTKLMTAYLAEPRAPHALRRAFAVTNSMVGVPGYTIGLRAGDRVTPRDMLAAALIASANDAANALAVHRAGSLHAFVAMMNAAARRLGLADTHYSNPSGIVDAGNHSSAWDVASLTRRVLQRPLLRSLVGKRAYQVGNTVFVSRNRLLWTYRGAIGVKTGSTTAAGNCLAVAAVRNGRTLVAVLLHARKGQFAAAARLLDWGFSHDR